MHFKPIETKRLILRRVKEQDAEDFFEMDSNPKVHLYLGNNPVTSLKESEEMINSILEQYITFGLGRLAIIHKKTKAFLGWSGLKYEQKLRENFSYYDLGYRLKEQYWGNGYATEAALASLNYGLNDLKLKEICGAAEIDHIASNTILKKIGLQPSGTFTYQGSLLNWYTLQNKNSEFE